MCSVWCCSCKNDTNACMHQVEEIRLMESRKSARLQQDSAEGHHLQLQYVHSLASPNITSHMSSSVIEVPESFPRNRYIMNRALAV